MIEQFRQAMWAVDNRSFDLLNKDLEVSELKPITAEMEKEQRLDAFVTGRQIERFPGAFAMVRVGNRAIIPMIGMIRPRPSFSFFSMFGATTSLHVTSMDFARAENDPAIREIILAFDSGGGVTDAVDEFSNQVASAKTPTKAYVEGSCASAAYWIASACDEIVCASAANLGSIGVQGRAVDTSKFDEEMGIREITITSKNASNKNPDPSTDAFVESMQTRVDAVEDVMINTIATNRGVSAETVIKEYGQGALFVGKQAVDAGLADSIGSLQGLLGASLQNSSRSFPMDENEKLAAHVKTLTVGAAYVYTMAGTFQPMPLTEAGLRQVNGGAEAMDSIIKPHAEAAKADGVKEGHEAATKGESDRIAAIDEAFKEAKPEVKAVADAMKATPGVDVAAINAAVVEKITAGTFATTPSDPGGWDGTALDLGETTSQAQLADDPAGKGNQVAAAALAAAKVTADQLNGPQAQNAGGN